MGCNFIEGYGGVQCMLYHYSEIGRMEALTQEYKDKVCHEEEKLPEEVCQAFDGLVREVFLTLE